MEFRIKCDSLPRTIVKSFLFTVITVLIVFVSCTTLFVATAFISVNAELSALPKFLWAFAEGMFLIPFEKPLPFLIFLFVPFAFFLFPYFRRNDRLLIDGRGIHLDCRFRPLWSWHVAWEDIQLPITYRPSPDHLFPRNTRNGILYIQLNRLDDDQPKEKRGWFDFLFIRLGGRIPSNPVFILDKVSAWETDNEVNGKAANTEKDKRPIVVREIERHLGQGAIKKIGFALHTLAEQARETLRKKRKMQPSPYDPDPVVARSMCVGAFFFFMLGVAAYFRWILDTYLLNPSWMPYIFVALPVAAISLWPLRRYKNAWLTSLAVASVLGGTFTLALFSSAQLGASLWGQQETHTFVLQAPLPFNPQDGKRSSRLSEQLWQSGEKENSAERSALKLEIFSGLSRQPYQPGDRIELSVRRGLFGQYVLNIKEADDYFKQRLNE